MLLSLNDYIYNYLPVCILATSYKAVLA